MKDLTEKDLLYLEKLYKNTSPWRRGIGVGRTIYAGDTMVGVVDNANVADHIVIAVNVIPRLVAELRKLR